MKHKSTLILAAILFIAGGLLAGCESVRTPEDVIVEYLEALAASDQTSAVANSCAAWEEEALAEGASFVNVEVTLIDPDCQVQTQTDTEATVTCTGRFLFSYDAGEEQELSLVGRVFSLIKEGGEWRMCGYKLLVE